MTSLNEKTKKLLDLNTDLETAQDLVKAIKEKIEPLREDMLDHLRRTKQFSIKFEDAMISRAVRKTLKVVDVSLLVAHLKEKGLTDYIEERPNELFGQLKDQALIQGIELPGTLVSETEFVSIRTATEGAERRNVKTGDYIPHE